MAAASMAAMEAAAMEAHGVFVVRVSTRTIHRPETGSEAGGHGIGTFRTEDLELFPNLAVAEEAEHTPCLLCFMPPQPWRTRPPTFFATACPDNEFRAQMRDAGLPPVQEGLPGGAAAAAGDRESQPACGVAPPSPRPAGPRWCRQFMNTGLQVSVFVIVAKAAIQNPVAGQCAFAANGPWIPAFSGMAVNMTTPPER